ncbi:permease [Alkalibacter rhizosphaerae]|uniref:Permease n=1 Tax=Alkalibacter rhizosphaerae TaxID=2815577 RepID=A0A974XGP6_9FIRM|nr:permease [Alkalibacter rhizosphaerae]QSX09366.1 permease [Alkalibacter rhizosphaerae]
MKNFLKRYRFTLVMVLVTIGLYLFSPTTGEKALDTIGYSFKELLSVLPPIFILLGLLDVWVPKETMMKYMGEGSGLKGVLISIFIGSAAAGPLYGAFPLAGVFMKKGVKFTNVLIFIGAWSTTKIPMFLFELTALGTRFAVTRLIASMVGIFIIAHLVDKSTSKEEVDQIYATAVKMNS